MLVPQRACIFKQRTHLVYLCTSICVCSYSVVCALACPPQAYLQGPGSLLQAQALLGSSLQASGGLMLPALGSSVNPFIGGLRSRGGAQGYSLQGAMEAGGFGMRLPSRGADGVSSDADEPMSTEEAGGTPQVRRAAAGGSDPASDWDPLFNEELLFDDAGACRLLPVAS